MTEDAENSPMQEAAPHDAVRDVDVRGAAAMSEEGVLVLDVREPDEWAAGHMAGAVHIPLGDLDPTTVPDGSPIVVVCRSGNRSSKAAVGLQESGRDVFNMAGGMKAWQQAGLPVLTDAGEPGTV